MSLFEQISEMTKHKVMSITKNEMIAKYMGMRIEESKSVTGKDVFIGICFYPEYPIGNEWHCSGSNRDDIENSLKSFDHKFHESYDWLMPVVKKINSSVYDHIAISYDRVFLIRENMELRQFKYENHGGMKGAIYAAVCEYIENLKQE